MKQIIIVCDAFIVPNPIMDLDSDFYRYGVENGIYEKPISVKDMNNCKENKYVQLWLCSEICDNLNDHTFYVDHHKFGYVSSLIPIEIIKGIKEGDKFTFLSVMKDLNSGEEFEFQFNCTANQKSYRYRNFGNFEEVAEKLSIA